MPEWTCPKCGRTFGATNARHSCTSQSPNAFFAPYPDALPLYRRIHKTIAGFGPVEVEATKTQVAFRAKRRFAHLWIPAMSLKRGPPELFLTFDLGRRVRSPRIKESYAPRRGHWMHHMRIARASDIDAEARAWLREAYDAAGGAKPSERPR